MFVSHVSSRCDLCDTVCPKKTSNTIVLEPRRTRMPTSHRKASNSRSHAHTPETFLQTFAASSFGTYISQAYTDINVALVTHKAFIRGLTGFDVTNNGVVVGTLVLMPGTCTPIGEWSLEFVGFAFDPSEECKPQRPRAPWRAPDDKRSSRTFLA
jgi:hypothetical protein